MTFRLLSVTTLFAMAIVSCNSSVKTDNTNFEDHTSQNSLDWSGTYYGITPCASCEGIEIELSLTNDFTYVLEKSYLGEKEEATTTTGKFSWEGNKIKLEGIKADEAPSMYKVEEGRIRQLDLKGNIIEGELASHYILSKNGNPEVEDKKWRLIELNGKPIEGNVETHYIIFHAKDQKIEAKANCNTLQFNYKIRNRNKLTTQSGISTLMACTDGLEKEFVNMLKTVDNLSVSLESLTLNKGKMAPIAKFELVK